MRTSFGTRVSVHDSTVVAERGRDKRERVPFERVNSRTKRFREKFVTREAVSDAREPSSSVAAAANPVKGWPNKSANAASARTTLPPIRRLRLSSMFGTRLAHWGLQRTEQHVRGGFMSAAQMHVRHMLDRIEHSYSEPITLRSLSAELQRQSAYL